MDVQERSTAVRRHVAQALAGSGVEVEDVSLHPAGKRRLVRVVLVRDLAALPADDHTTPVEPLTLDEIAEATRTVGQVLEESDVMGQMAYTLEVSSPGVDRPLTRGPQFRRNVGRLVSLRLDDGTELRGRLRAVTPETLRLEVQDLPLDRVVRGWVEVEFTRPGKEDS